MANKLEKLLSKLSSSNKVMGAAAVTATLLSNPLALPYTLHDLRKLAKKPQEEEVRRK